jgi:hypothetical protein
VQGIVRLVRSTVRHAVSAKVPVLASVISRISVRQSLAASLVAASAMALTAAPVQAQGKLDARYTASLAGIPIGRGAWVIEVNDTQYTAAASGTTAGMMRVFASGEGTGAVRGTITPAGQLLPNTYASTIKADKKNDQVRMVLRAGTVKDFSIEPPLPPSPDRVPVGDEHRQGVSDPMSAWIIHAPGTGDPVNAASCQQKLAVFDGRMRYDLQLAYKRMDKVKAGKGYSGAVVVCAVYFTPIAGHIPDRAALKYLVRQRDMELWFAPIAGTRMLVPFRASAPTPFGEALLEATQFVSVPSVTRASATDANANSQ